MDYYRFSAGVVSRRQGRSFTGAAAYRSGAALFCEHDRRTHVYRRRRDIIYTAILMPDNAPQEFLDLQTFCNAVESAEKRKDARTAREIVIALPRQLTFETNTVLVQEFVSECFVAQGMCAVVAIHRGDNKDKKRKEHSERNTPPYNPHCHILLTTRTVGPNGFSDRKNRDWDRRERLVAWREQWATIQNKFFTRKGLEAKVTHESYEKQGVILEPKKHLGPVLSAMERRRIRTHLGDINRAIDQRNREREALNKQLQFEQDRDYDSGRSR